MMERKLQIIFYLTVITFMPTWFSELYPEDVAWMINDLSLMTQALMIAVMIHWFVRNPYVKTFALYLIIWRVAGIIATYLSYNGKINEAMMLSYFTIALFAISLIHMVIKKWYYSTQQ